MSPCLQGALVIIVDPLLGSKQLHNRSHHEQRALGGLVVNPLIPGEPESERCISVIGMQRVT
jgi:hypothetical protein